VFELLPTLLLVVPLGIEARLQTLQSFGSCTTLPRLWHGYEEDWSMWRFLMCLYNILLSPEWFADCRRSCNEYPNWVQLNLLVKFQVQFRYVLLDSFLAPPVECILLRRFLPIVYVIVLVGCLLNELIESLRGAHLKINREHIFEVFFTVTSLDWFGLTSTHPFWYRCYHLLLLWVHIMINCENVVQRWRSFSHLLYEQC